MGSLFRHEEHGFTLAEVVIMMLILGFVFLIVTPRMAAILAVGPDSVARRLAATIRSCREHSIMTHRPYQIVLDIPNNLYYVETVEERLQDELTFVKDTSILHRAVVLPRDVHILDVISPLTGKVKEGTAYIHVLQDGLFPGAIVHLINEQKQMYTLTFLPLTGRLHYEEGYFFEEIESRS